MQTTENTLVGHITEVSGGRLTATLHTESEGFRPVMRVGRERISVGQIGTQLLVKHGDIHILGQVVRMWEDPPDKMVSRGNGGTLTGTVARPSRKRYLTLLPLGQINRRGEFDRGVKEYPVTGAEVHLVTARQLEVLFDRFRSEELALGRLSSRAEIDVYLDPNPSSPVTWPSLASPARASPGR
jgi:hypothetical protein